MNRKRGEILRMKEEKKKRNKRRSDIVDDAKLRPILLMMLNKHLST